MIDLNKSFDEKTTFDDYDSIYKIKPEEIR